MGVQAYARGRKAHSLRISVALSYSRQDRCVSASASLPSTPIAASPRRCIEVLTRGDSFEVYHLMGGKPRHALRGVKNHQELLFAESGGPQETVAPQQGCCCSPSVRKSRLCPSSGTAFRRVHSTPIWHALDLPPRVACTASSNRSPLLPRRYPVRVPNLRRVLRRRRVCLHRRETGLNRDLLEKMKPFQTQNATRMSTAGRSPAAACERSAG